MRLRLMGEVRFWGWMEGSGLDGRCRIGLLAGTAAREPRIRDAKDSVRSIG